MSPNTTSQEVPLSDARLSQIHNAAAGPLWTALTKERTKASAAQILAHNWKVRWSVIRLENDLVKTLLDALTQHPGERAQFVKNLAELTEESEAEEASSAEAPGGSDG